MASRLTNLTLSPAEKSLSSSLWWCGLALLSFLLSLLLQGVPSALTSGKSWQMELYGEVDNNSAAQGGQGGRIRQQIMAEGGEVSADYTFVNFNNDPLQINFSMPLKELNEYRQGYGYTQGDLDRLVVWQREALEGTYQLALRSGWDQSRLNEASLKIQNDFRLKQEELFRSRGFVLRGKNLLAPDIPGIVRRNIRPLNDVAQQFNLIAAGRGYDAQETVASVLSMVQTALYYKELAATMDGRMTGGISPPLVTMAEGRGDCDSKSALLAAILRNWSQLRLIGVGVPGHYLLGILQNPAKGQAFVEYQGMRYILLEAAGPGWLPPGTIADSTLARLNSGEELRLEAL